MLRNAHTAVSLKSLVQQVYNKSIFFPFLLVWFVFVILLHCLGFVLFCFLGGADRAEWRGRNLLQTLSEWQNLTRSRVFVPFARNSLLCDQVYILKTPSTCTVSLCDVRDLRTVTVELPCKSAGVIPLCPHTHKHTIFNLPTPDTMHVILISFIVL